MGSKEAEKYRFNKSVILGVIGKCAGCFYCIYACPEDAILDTKPPTIIDDKCTRCMKCIEACPRRLIRIIHY